MSYYSDSSVLVKRHVLEVGSPWFRTLADPRSGNIIITAQLSIVEVFSALNRRCRESSISPADYTIIAAEFARVVSGEYEVVPPSVKVIDGARVLLERYPLRAGDAIQLASAIIANENLRAANLPAGIFLSADDRLLAAAQAEGLTTDDPRLHP
ncbi:MAG: type II toxin-antitoxin system VapC family toxin [Pyrinomonadaceae bacterium MAG19_C2-C3]|nr:type II toxin-antitoxin system VapC family toxin [Pyrinomonadaceae bacterium MAG19_C2-C3]